MKHRVDQLAAQQVQRRPVIQLYIVEGVSQDFRAPHETGLHVAQEEQVNRAEREARNAQSQPDFACPLQLCVFSDRLREHAE